MALVRPLSAVEGEVLAYEIKVWSLIILLNYSVFGAIETMD